jgi:hypothetical protein
MMGALDELESTIGGLANAALAPVRHVARDVGEFAETMSGKISAAWHEFFGSPTFPGETNWNAYSRQGEAAERARSAMTGERHNGLSVADYTGQVSDSIYSAADALCDAQRAMPEPVPVATMVGDGGIAGAVAGSRFGPQGAVVSAVAGAGTSLFEANQLAADARPRRCG